MWIRREFSWVTGHEVYGNGWRPTECPDFDPVLTFGVAHDAMEHFKLDGTIEEEARAFGAILWGRHFGGWWHRSNSFRTDFCDVMHDDLAKFVAESGSVQLPPPTRPLKNGEAEEQLIRCVCRARPALHDDWAPVFGYDTERADIDLASYLGWMRIGYRMAQRRWGRHMSQSAFADLFELVATHPLCSDKFEPDSENDKLVINILPSRQKAEVKLVEYIDPYDY